MGSTYYLAMDNPSERILIQSVGFNGPSFFIRKI
jgi:hypothetical protein